MNSANAIILFTHNNGPNTISKLRSIHLLGRSRSLIRSSASENEALLTSNRPSEHKNSIIRHSALLFHHFLDVLRLVRVLVVHRANRLSASSARSGFAASEPAISLEFYLICILPQTLCSNKYKQTCTRPVAAVVLCVDPDGTFRGCLLTPTHTRTNAHNVDTSAKTARLGLRMPRALSLLFDTNESV